VAASQFQLSKIDSILPWPECKICTVQDLALNTKQEKHENEPDQISLLHFPAFETFCSSYQDCWDMVLQQVTHTASPQHEVVKRASYIVAFEPLTLLSTCTATIITTTSSLHSLCLLAVQLLQHNFVYKTNLPSLLGKCTFGTTLKQTHMRFHRMHVMTSTAMEATKPMDAERIMTTSMANETPSGYCFQLPHTGRQSEVFPTVLQEKPSWH